MKITGRQLEAQKNRSAKFHCFRYKKKNTEKNIKRGRLDNLHDIGADILAQDIDVQGGEGVEGAPEVLHVPPGVGPPLPLTQHAPARQELVLAPAVFQGLTQCLHGPGVSDPASVVFGAFCRIRNVYFGCRSRMDLNYKS